MRYTLLEHDTLDAELPRCAEKGVGLVIGGVFNSGITATGAVPGAYYNYAPATPEIMHRVSRIEAVCRRHGVPLPAAALQFPLGHPAVAAVIPGAFSPDAGGGEHRQCQPADSGGVLGRIEGGKADPRRRADAGRHGVGWPL